MDELAFGRKLSCDRERKKGWLDNFLINNDSCPETGHNQESTSFLIMLFSYSNKKYRQSEQGKF